MDTYPNILSFLIWPIAIVIAVGILLLRDRIFTGNYRLGPEWGPETKRFKIFAAVMFVWAFVSIVLMLLLALISEDPKAWERPGYALFVWGFVGTVFILIMPHPQSPEANDHTGEDKPT